MARELYMIDNADRNFLVVSKFILNYDVRLLLHAKFPLTLPRPNVSCAFFLSNQIIPGTFKINAR
jgi:hypothetical protein